MAHCGMLMRLTFNDHPFLFLRMLLLLEVKKLDNDSIPTMLIEVCYSVNYIV